jgi:hypothetical protein
MATDANSTNSLTNWCIWPTWVCILFHWDVNIDRLQPTEGDSRKSYRRDTLHARTEVNGHYGSHFRPDFRRLGVNETSSDKKNLSSNLWPYELSSSDGRKFFRSLSPFRLCKKFS